MKILFIYPDIREEEGCIGNTMQGSYNDLGGMFYIGLAYVSAVLKENGHETKLVHITDMNNALSQVKKAIDEWLPNIIAYSATTNMFPYICTISNELKKEMLTQVLGGAHATLNPEEALKKSGVDYVVVGEGEYPLLELCEGRSEKEINNLVYSVGDVIRRNPLRPLIDLDELPFPDWDLFDYQNCYDGNLKRLNVVLGRGCPYKCAYCCNHALATIYKGLGNYVRFPSPDKAIAIIKEGLNKYPELEYVDFRDDNLPMNPKWFEEFCLKYHSEINLPCVCIARVNHLTEQNIQLLSYIQCRMVRIGVESGNEYMKKLCNREISNERVIKTFKLLHEYGIKTYAFLMIGLPYETPKMFNDTITLYAKLGTDLYHLSVFYPFKGTKFYDMCERRGWLTNKDVPDYFHESTLNQPSFSNDMIGWYIKNFDLLVDMKRRAKK